MGDGGEKIQLRFQEKRVNQQIFYDTIEDLLHDLNMDHDIIFEEGFNIRCDSIDWINY